MLCLLCFRVPIAPIDIFGEDGLKLDIKGVISKHFWFKPCAEDSYSNFICSTCWDYLNAFDKFYKDVEKAHQIHLLNPNLSIKSNDSEEFTSMTDDVHAYNSILQTSFKVEVSENSNDQSLEYNQDDGEPYNDSCSLIKPIPKTDPEDLDLDMKSESESEIPISELSKRIETDQKNATKVDNKHEAPTSSSRFKKTPTGEDIFHIKDGEWLATCYGEETTDKRISQKEFDKFLQKHMELSCDFCLKPNANFTALQTHFQEEHDAGKAFVTCCTKKFYHRAPLVDHILLHKLPNYFTCVLCSKVLTGRKTLMEHQKTHNKKLVYKCPGCDKKFHRKINLDRHKDVHVDLSERTIECSWCDKLFASKFTLKQHTYDAHKIGVSTVVCELCGKICRDQASFRRHQYDHTNEEKEFFTCEKCGTRLATKDGLRRHKKSQHPVEKKQYFCNYCGMESTTAHALHRHITYMHTVEPRFKCTLCDKAFKRALRLKPNQEDINNKLICSSCWIPVESFHRFYEEIKEAHCSFQEIKPVVANDDDSQQGQSTIDNNNFDDNNIFIREEIKLEDIDSTTVSLEIQCNINPLEISARSDEEGPAIKSDSDSEIPLSKLCKQIQQNKYKASKTHNAIQKNDKTKKLPAKKICKTIAKQLSKKDDQTPEGIKTDAPLVPQSKETNEDNPLMLDGKWLATSYSDESFRKPACTEELDKFLKLNIELSCGICHKAMDEFAKLHPHFSKCHDKAKPFVTCCGKRLKYRAHIVDHILVHQTPDYFKCVECSKIWPSRRNLKEHLHTHNKNFIYQCEKCQKSFCSKAAVDLHQEVHLVERPFKCEECNRFYTSEYRLKQHAYNSHQYKKICEQCGQVFREKEAFVRHLLKHTNQPKPFFQCEICPAKLSSKKILQKHYKFQHPQDSTEQNCNVCGIKVKSSQALKRHMNFVHKYQREHKCTMCEKAFKRALTLKSMLSYGDKLTSNELTLCTASRPRLWN